MPPQKYLKDFLKEDEDQEEPFHFPIPITKPTKSHNPINPKTSFSSFHKYPCFSSSSSSAVSSTNSPLIRYSAPSTSLSPLPRGGQSDGGLFLHVPSKTAALLLEAAMRIQKQSSKPKPKSKNSRFGILGSVLRRLRGKNKGRNRGMIDVEAIEDNGIVGLEIDEGEMAECCSSPFRFALMGDEDSIDRPSPGFGSPATASPSRRQFEDRSSLEEECTVKREADDEEDKEQSSPVSVLEPPFEDDDDGHEGEEGDEAFEGTNSYDLECSYAFVQRAKKKLLHKLRRFEKLAGLDPIELEKRIQQEEEEGDEDDSIELQEEEDECEDDQDEEEDTEASLIEDVLCQLGYQEIQQPGMKMLINHLINEEQHEERQKHSDNSLVATNNRVCRRLESWQSVEVNSIDMIIRMDLQKESVDWTKSLEQANQVALAVEAEISVTLLVEILEELVRA